MFLVRMPDSWPRPLVATIAMIALAALDLTGAYAAKEAVLRRSGTYAAVGAALFLLVFWVYACTLQYADLAVVTLGWIVVLQVGVVLLNHWRYGAQMSAGAWVAVSVIIAAQAYLLLGQVSAVPPATDSESTPAERTTTPAELTTPPAELTTTPADARHPPVSPADTRAGESR